MDRGRVVMRALGLAAGIGVLGGLLLLPVTAYALTVAERMPLLYAPVVGAWFLPVVTALVVVGRPGAGLVAGTVAGLVMSLGTGLGMPGMAALGLVLELVLAVRLYRRWGNGIFAIGIVIACLLHALSAWSRFGIASAGILVQLAFVGLLLISGLGALVLARLIARVLDGTAVTRGLGPHLEQGKPDRLAEDDGWQYDGGLARKPDTTP